MVKTASVLTMKVPTRANANLDTLAMESSVQVSLHIGIKYNSNIYILINANKRILG